jgi:hypothetical protein
VLLTCCLHYVKLINFRSTSKRADSVAMHVQQHDKSHSDFFRSLEQQEIAFDSLAEQTLRDLLIQINDRLYADDNDNVTSQPGNNTQQQNEHKQLSPHRNSSASSSSGGGLNNQFTNLSQYPHLIQEIDCWRQAFPHFRIKGKRLKIQSPQKRQQQQPTDAATSVALSALNNESPSNIANMNNNHLQIHQHHSSSLRYSNQNTLTRSRLHSLNIKTQNDQQQPQQQQQNKRHICIDDLTLQGKSCIIHETIINSNNDQDDERRDEIYAINGDPYYEVLAINNDTTIPYSSLQHIRNKTSLSAVRKRRRLERKGAPPLTPERCIQWEFEQQQQQTLSIDLNQQTDSPISKHSSINASYYQFDSNDQQQISH